MATAPKISRSNAAAVYCVLGATGTGKTSWVMDQIVKNKPRRLLIWDTKGEFAAEGYAMPVPDLFTMTHEIRRIGKAGHFRLAYRPRGDDKQLRAQFDFFCTVAWHTKRLTVVAEELADVTQPGFACAGWRRITSQGRTEGLTIYGLSQRPASIDKHFFSNASLVRSSRLNFAGDIKVVSNVLRMPVDNLTGFEWISRDMQTGAITQGK